MHLKNKYGTYCLNHFTQLEEKEKNKSLFSRCKAILRYGKRKGECCNCKATVNNVCNRHKKK